MKYQIGVIGSAECYDNEILEKAKEIGRQIAKHGCILLTGAATGVSYEAVRGAKESGGTTVGISPAADIKEHLEKYKSPVEDFDVLIYTGFGYKGRNVPFIRSCDGVVAISGRTGTLNEFTIAYDENKVVGLLEGTGGVCDDVGIRKFLSETKKKGGKIVSSYDPLKLVEELLENLDQIS